MTGMMPEVTRLNEHAVEVDIGKMCWLFDFDKPMLLADLETKRVAVLYAGEWTVSMRNSARKFMDAVGIDLTVGDIIEKTAAAPKWAVEKEARE